MTIHRYRNSAKRCETHLSQRLDEQVATISITDPAALVALAREAPVSAARETQIAMTTLQTGFNKHRIGIMGAGYASAYHMLRTDGAWEQFIKDPGWDDLSNRPKNTMRARNHILLHVMRYVFRAEGETARRRVRVYAGMLQDCFDKSFKPEGVIPLINSRGIEVLRAEGVALRKNGTKNRYLDDLNNIDDEDPAPSPTQPAPHWRRLKPAQIDEAVALLNTFNGAMLDYLTRQAERATPPRSRDQTCVGSEQYVDQPVESAWRQR